MEQEGIAIQTFLPFPDFEESARVLDRQRLGKQRLEALHLLRCLRDPSLGWQNHPALRMWRGYEKALGTYAQAICAEWKRRGYRDTISETLFREFGARPWVTSPRALARKDLPPWLGREDFHASHRATLLWKNPDWYGQFGWKEAPVYGYAWPVPLLGNRGIRPPSRQVPLQP
ncbi:MAG TPA: MSMEG_6728 family protein [Chthonomonadaceae bacterium]|nr:MSMEG_6728 family protein [Chthonomonadaceae bacterium]